jgi:alkylation response protein AidB-like acyl-CoA dehydrogenase
MASLTEDAVRELLDARLVRRDQGGRTTVMGIGNEDLEEGRAYLAALADVGLAVPSWPAEHGGRGADDDEVATVARVMREYAVPDLYAYAIGLRMAGPTLLVHGRPDQQERWLRPIATGIEIWCQMFSEPDAGSDLANVATLARLDGEEWVLDGQKVWTSRGAYSQWGLCLARSDVDAPKHRGLTMIVLRMDTRGVEVRPLRQMNGDRHFSEVFLTSARVPDANRIGGVGEGWRVAMTVLAHERAGADRTTEQQAGFGRNPSWLAGLAARGGLATPVRRDRAMALYAYERAVRFTRDRVAAAEQAGATPGPEGSGQKLHGSALFKRRAGLVADSEGAAAMLTDSEGHLELLTAPSMSIRGGTDEIQHNIVGERVLGLPAEPRVDRDIPWAQSRRGRTGDARPG